MLNLLLIGSGGREHALVWKLAQSRRVGDLWCVPGNAGISQHAKTAPVAAEDIGSLVRFAKEKRIDLTFSGPEAPLAAGLADRFCQEGLRIVGPTQAAAQLESSKIFAKQFMSSCRIPTARFEVVQTLAQGLDLVQRWGFPVVLKVDGLAAGKGVKVCHNLEDARAFLTEVMDLRIFGQAGDRVVVEECLIGEEATAMAFCDGESLIPMPVAQDHKRLLEGDQGPNTGGMGAYAPAPCATEAVRAQIGEEIFRPFLKGLKSEGLDFRGVIYFGLMLTVQGPRVLEFNVRFGDPEAQVVLPLLETDLVEILQALAERRLVQTRPVWRAKAAVCVVLASKGYPGPYEKGKVVHGLSEAAADSSVMLFHAGTKTEAGQIATAGGRVLGVTAVAEELGEAIQHAYTAVRKISFDGMHFRKDIGARALASAMEFEDSQGEWR